RWPEAPERRGRDRDRTATVQAASAIAPATSAGAAAGGPTPASLNPMSTPAVTATPATPTSRVTATLEGSAGGASARYTIPYPGNGRKLTLELEYTPADEAIVQGVSLGV